MDREPFAMGVKIAIGGKGGVGKTTVCAVWARLFAEDGFDVLGIDADSYTSLCCAFGIDRKSTRLNSSHTDISRMPASS